MKKKIFSLLAVVLFMSSSLNAISINFSKSELAPVQSLCATYADFAAASIEMDGGNYYQGWFESFAYCVSLEDYSLDY